MKTQANIHICEICKNSFYRGSPKTRSAIKHCSIKCKSISQKGRPSTKPPRIMLEKNCLQCSKSFTTNKNDNCKYCCHRCSTDGLKISRLGKNNPSWKGGITPENQKLRSSAKYEQWRKSVFERDHYTCKLCGQYGGKLNADHIKAWAKYPKFRFDINNGRTLCVDCHSKTKNYKRNVS